MNKRDWGIETRNWAYGYMTMSALVAVYGFATHTHTEIELGLGGFVGGLINLGTYWLLNMTGKATR